MYWGEFYWWTMSNMLYNRIGTAWMTRRFYFDNWHLVLMDYLSRFKLWSTQATDYGEKTIWSSSHFIKTMSTPLDYCQGTWGSTTMDGFQSSNMRCEPWPSSGAWSWCWWIDGQQGKDRSIQEDHAEDGGFGWWICWWKGILLATTTHPVSSDWRTSNTPTPRTEWQTHGWTDIKVLYL